MKHNQRLLHLSEEHASALKLATAVRALSPEDESALPAVAQQVREVFKRELLPHFTGEEKFVVPRLIEIGRQDLVDQMRREHEHLVALIDALENPTAEGVYAFATALTAHVRFEENIVWEAIEPGAGMSFEDEAA